jgi:hypothetical protein
VIWLWIAGGVVLAGGAVLPPLLARRRSAHRAYVAARDRAHAAMSRLEWAIDAAGGGGDGRSGDPTSGGGDGGTGGDGNPGDPTPVAGDGGAGGDGRAGDATSGGAAHLADALVEARRCFTLAGSALGGADTTHGFDQAETWARRGLAALGEDA